jgi:PAS domain S-box-containing protein
MLWGKGKSAESEKVAKELEKIRGSDEIGTLAKAFLDISKQLDETLISLKSANTYLENIFANSADSIAIVDLESKFTRWNKTAEEIYGYTFEEIKDISEIGLYADPEEYYAMLKQLRQHDFIRNYEINMKKKDGSVFPASLSIRFLRDTDNEIIGSITGSRDLSEIKLIMMHLKNEIYQHEQARQAMLDVEQKLANIIDFLPDATFVIDKKGKVMAWNKAIEEMTGVSAKDMVGKGNYEYALPFYGERRPILIDLVLEPDGIEKYAEVKREDQALMIVNHFNNFRGKETYLFGKASALIDLHGNIIGSIETIRDITALRKAETDRLQFSKLESLSILAGGIAHDFNNILAAILGNISLAMLEQNMGEQGRQRLTAAEKACLQAQNLAGQLLTFAKGGAPIKKLISLESLVAEAASLACRGSQVRCEYGFAQDLLAIAGDPGQINQVFQNLIINAFQAMPGGGTVRIQGENVKIGEKSELPLMAGNYVKTSIQDHGSGIPKKYLQRIFDPYFTTKQQGSGLGLATAYSIITNHHGQISVESRLGEGTTFHVYLPASDQKITQQPEETTELLTGKGKILVMDDEAMVREVLGAMLPTLGYEAEVAKDGVEAIELFSQAQGSAESFAAVILDLTVPAGMGGKETIEKLLKIDPQVKAIVSSGYSDDPIMADFQEYGFIAVIAKPYKVAELGKVLNHALIGNE